jgi:SAM-dependent methyltransferase
VEQQSNRMTDQRYLVTDQYKNPGNLETRLDFYKRFSSNPVTWFEWVFSHFDFHPEAYLLEIGCGTGQLWLENKDRIPDSWRLILGDLSLQMLRKAARNLQFLRQQVQFQVLDAQLLKYETGCFDVVIANHVLYHVPTPARALLEAHRVLKPGGCLIAATNGTEHLREIWDLVEGFPPVWKHIAPGLPPQRYSFNLENGEDMLQKYFESVRVYRYPGELAVTEADPVLSYILSLFPHEASGITDREINQFRHFIQNRLDQEGGTIYIQPSTGLFIAEKSSTMSTTSAAEQQEGNYE